ncbi:MAG: hypothetical protein FJY17_02690 [Bacteroidetes bacterium]|nr:hypothetical protein [Bacteroidota bacterium]MBM3417813.1 hypothetical protein [Bacteroidota bacterium]
MFSTFNSFKSNSSKSRGGAIRTCFWGVSLVVSIFGQ